MQFTDGLLMRVKRASLHMSVKLCKHKCFSHNNEAHSALRVTQVSIRGAISLHDVYFPDGSLMTAQ